MSKPKSYFLVILLLILLPPIFLYLEFGFYAFSVDKLIQPIIYTCAFFVTLNKNLRRYLLFAVLVSLFLMVLFYLFWQLDFANLFGSMGFGMLIIYMSGHLPELVKKGNLEKV